METEAMNPRTTKGAMTKQGVRDLNHYGPRPRKDASGDRVEDERKPSSSVAPIEKHRPID